MMTKPTTALTVAAFVLAASASIGTTTVASARGLTDLSRTEFRDLILERLQKRDRLRDFTPAGIENRGRLREFVSDRLDGRGNVRNLPSDRIYRRSNIRNLILDLTESDGDDQGGFITDPMTERAALRDLSLDSLEQRWELQSRKMGQAPTRSDLSDRLSELRQSLGASSEDNDDGIESVADLRALISGRLDRRAELRDLISDRLERQGDPRDTILESSDRRNAIRDRVIDLLESVDEPGDRTPDRVEDRNELRLAILDQIRENGGLAKRLEQIRERVAGNS